MNIEQGKIYTFKLNSGEELVAKVIKTEFGFVTVTHPLSMAMAQQGLQMIPSLFSVDMEKSVEINMSSISMTAQAREDVAKAYTESTTGLDLSASKQMLAG
jgi:hypothetical protein